MAPVVSPSISVWSRPMWVMQTASVFSTALVASRRPPMPASSTTMSQPLWANQTRATAVTAANSQGSSPVSASICSAARRTWSVTAASWSGGIISPLIWNRSRNSSTKGEMVQPTLYPAFCRMLDSMAAVLPLPLVPTMCTNFRLASGLPSRASSCRSDSTPGIRVRWGRL